MFNYQLVLVFFLIHFGILDDNHLFFKSIFNLDRLDHSTIQNNSIKLIDCREYKENVTLIRKIAEGVVKEVWLGKWSSNGYIAVSFLKNSIYLDDFLNNIYMLRNFTLFNSRYTTQYLGECDNKILFTRFYSLGPLSNLAFILKDKFLFKNLKSKHCFHFCISYVRVIDYLHSSPLGRRVMCDSNDLAKLASQFLIDDDFNLIANDLDALPDASFELIQCGQNQLIGDLIAPEQRTQSYYDQQIDIYKLPFICNYILNECPNDELLNLLISRLHRRCLSQLPSKRPNSSEILNEYLIINYTLFN